MVDSLATPSPRRGLLLGGALLLASLALAAQLARSGLHLPLYDFVEYWAAGRLNAQGANPYDPELIHQLERATGRTEDGVLMWNPPWTLPLVMPFGLLPAQPAHLVWLLVQLGVLLLGTALLWRIQGGADDDRWLAWALTFTFLPTYFALTAGQISPLLLLGAVAFLALEKRGQWALAGAATVLLAIKPHLTYLFWLALLLWALQHRRWSLLLGGALTGLALTALALLCNPDVLGQYWHTITTHPPAQYRSPTLGTLLRLALGAEHFRLQFLALVPGLVWFVPYWLRQRRNWQWSHQMPLLLLASMLTAAYGAWPFDLVLLLVPILHSAVLLCHDRHRARLALLGYALINVLALALIIGRAEYFWFLWMTPALLVVYRFAGSEGGSFPRSARGAAGSETA